MTNNATIHNHLLNLLENSGGSLSVRKHCTGKRAQIKWKTFEELIPSTKKKSQPTKRYTLCYEQSSAQVFSVQIMMNSSAYWHVPRYTIQNWTFKVKCTTLPNHGWYWYIEVPLQQCALQPHPTPKKLYLYSYKRKTSNTYDTVSSASQTGNITANGRYFFIIFKPIVPRWTLIGG